MLRWFSDGRHPVDQSGGHIMRMKVSKAELEAVDHATAEDEEDVAADGQAGSGVGAR
jgi:hypothetical protein